jgi:hypothetical protein
VFVLFIGVVFSLFDFVLVQDKIDAQLFLIKYLIILKEQISPFDVSLSSKEKTLDFSHIKGSEKRTQNQKKTLIE